MILGIMVSSSSLKAIAQSSAYYSKEVEHNATVGILAISSSIHIGSGNQEIYLADISFRGIEHQLAKLVDVYSVNGYPVRLPLLRERRLLRMRLMRHEQCDVKGQLFFLSDDPAMVFDLSIHAQLKNHAEDVIPCYAVGHDATRLAKR